MKPGKHREVTSTSERHLAQVAFLNNPPSAFIPKAEVEKRPKDVSDLTRTPNLFWENNHQDLLNNTLQWLNDLSQINNIATIKTKLVELDKKTTIRTSEHLFKNKGKSNNEQRLVRENISLQDRLDRSNRQWLHRARFGRTILMTETNHLLLLVHSSIQENSTNNLLDSGNNDRINILMMKRQKNNLGNNRKNKRETFFR